MEEKIRCIFESGFDIKKNVRIDDYRFEYIACRYDVQDRTMAISKKEIDKYVLRENVYFIQMKLNEETFKKEMEKLFKTLKDSVDIIDDHYETLTALGLSIKSYVFNLMSALSKGNPILPLLVIAAALVLLAVSLIITAVNVLFVKKSYKKAAA